MSAPTENGNQTHPQTDATSERLRALENRLAVLEERLLDVEERGAPATGTPFDARADPRAPSDLSAQFWILEELKQRATASSPSSTRHSGAVAYAGVLGDESVQWQYSRPADHVLELDFADSAAQLDAIGSPVRMRILQGVLNGAHSVAQLGELPDMGSTGQLYHHLNQLAAAGWLTSPRRGHWEVPAEKVIPLLTIVLATQD